MAHNDSLKQNFINLRVDGVSFEKIADSLGVSKGTLIQWSKEFADEIHNLRQIRKELLREAFVKSEEAQIEKIAKLRNAIWDEIEKRDLTLVPFDKLVRTLSDFQKLVSPGEEKINFRGKEDFARSLTSDLQVSWEG